MKLFEKLALALLATVALAAPDEYEKTPDQASKNNRARTRNILRGGVASAVLVRGAFVARKQYKEWRTWRRDLDGELVSEVETTRSLWGLPSNPPQS